MIMVSVACTKFVDTVVIYKHVRELTIFRLQMEMK